MLWWNNHGALHLGQPWAWNGGHMRRNQRGYVFRGLRVPIVIRGYIGNNLRRGWELQQRRRMQVADFLRVFCPDQLRLHIFRYRVWVRLRDYQSMYIVVLQHQDPAS